MLTKNKQLTTCAMIAAMYTALCLVLAPISFGLVQVRISEALTILAVYSPLGAWSVTFGCFVANFVGFLTGTNVLGFWDIIWGTLATAIAGFLSWKLRNIRWKGLPILSTLPPVFVNAVVIGGELTILEMGKLSYWRAWLTNATFVGIGQVVSCIGFGLLLFYTLEKTGIGNRYLKKTDQ